MYFDMNIETQKQLGRLAELEWLKQPARGRKRHVTFKFRKKKYTALLTFLFVDVYSEETGKLVVRWLHSKL